MAVDVLAAKRCQDISNSHADPTVTTASRDSHYATYRKISNISRTKTQNPNDSRLALQLSLPNPQKPGVKSRMKM